MNGETSTEHLIRKELLDLLKEKPIEKIKVKELVERAGIGRSTFYFYFDSTYSVLQSIEDRFNEGLLEVTKRAEPFTSTLEYNPDPTFISGIAVGLTYLKDNADVVTTLFGPYGDTNFQARLIRQLSSIIATRLDINSFAKSSEFDMKSLVAHFLTQGWMSIVIRWIEGKSKASAEELARLFYFILMNCIYLNAQVTDSAM